MTIKDILKLLKPWRKRKCTVVAAINGKEYVLTCVRNICQVDATTGTTEEKVILEMQEMPKIED